MVVGCGKSGGASVGSAYAPITRAQVAAYARAVNLQAVDAVGMKALSAEREVDAAAQEDELARCMGIPARGRDVVRIVSPAFRTLTLGADSSVAADLTGPRNPASLAAEAAHDLAAAASKRGVACQEQYIQREYTQPGVPQVGVSSLRNPLSGVDGSVGFRFRVTVTGTLVAGVKSGAPKRRKPATVVDYVDVFLLDAGRAGIELEAGGTARPFPQATERRLLSLLYSRTQAHKL